MKEHLSSQTGATGFTIQQGRLFKRMSKDEEIFQVYNTWVDEHDPFCQEEPGFLLVHTTEYDRKPIRRVI